MPEVTPPHALRDPKALGLRMSTDVQPSAVVEPVGSDDQRVLLPVPDRVPQPRRVGIFGELAAVGEDRSMRTVRRFVEHHEERRRLYDPGHPAEIEKWDADRHAARKRAVFPKILD